MTLIIAVPPQNKLQPANGQTRSGLIAGHQACRVEGVKNDLRRASQRSGFRVIRFSARCGVQSRRDHLSRKGALRTTASRTFQDWARVI